MLVSMIETLLGVRQIRQYAREPVPDEVVRQLLEVARWTGSSRNSQPSHFVVVTIREKLRAISELRPNINRVAAAPLAVAIVLDGESDMSESYDEGRVTERCSSRRTRSASAAGLRISGTRPSRPRRNGSSASPPSA